MVNFLIIVSPDGIDKMFLESGDLVKAGRSLSISYITPENMGKNYIHQIISIKNKA